jgi:hypothetical protein
MTPARDSEPKCEARIAADPKFCTTHLLPMEACVEIAQLRAERDEAVRNLHAVLKTARRDHPDPHYVQPHVPCGHGDCVDVQGMEQAEAFLARLRPAPNGGGP